MLQVDTLRRAMHALGVERALVFMNFQQRLKDTEVRVAPIRGCCCGGLGPGAWTWPSTKLIALLMAEDCLK